MLDKPIFSLNTWDLLDYETVDPIDFSKLTNNILNNKSSISDSSNVNDGFYYLFKLFINNSTKTSKNTEIH